METAPYISMGELPEFLLNAATVAPVFVWGPPGIGKSSVVEQFAAALGMECQSLLGSQLAPEDIIGVPRIEDGKSVFCPPAQIARDQPYVLFLDELNACTVDVQKAFYSLIHDRRLGEYRLPEGSVIIGAGNRASDNAIVRPMSSALINRMIHVQVRIDVEAWLEWAMEEGIHPLVYQYVREHPRQLWAKPPKEERAYSTPRAWHLLSRLLLSWGDELTPVMARTLAESCLTPQHAQLFATWFKNSEQRFLLNHILKGERGWPEAAEERDLLHYLSLTFRDQLIKELPASGEGLNRAQEHLRARSMELLRSLVDLSPDLAQMVIVADEEGRTLPDWYMLEVGDALPRLLARPGDSGKKK